LQQFDSAKGNRLALVMYAKIYFWVNHPLSWQMFAKFLISDIPSMHWIWSSRLSGNLQCVTAPFQDIWCRWESIYLQPGLQLFVFLTHQCVLNGVLLKGGLGE